MARLDRQDDMSTLNKIRAEPRESGEGMPARDDELLRRSQEVARRLRRGVAADDEAENGL